MGDALAEVVQRSRLQPARGRSLAFWGVILLAVTEGVLFAVILFAWFYTWARTPQWPPEGIALPELGFSAVRSMVLLSTSASVWACERALRRGDRRRTWAWLLVTLGAAAFFLGTHVHEFVAVTPDEFLWSDNAYASLWWTILNLHGAHVAVGMVVWLYVLVRLGRGAYGPDDDVEVSTASIYWHFVDGVWVFVYASLYLLPNLLARG
ncbi:cytochrome c oxidase subunit 3 [Salsipaludibacter albus]|uniref:cytochrome c oxidase subunit 3 n=1 Tax=Salsipaludibacter albus TaxID=2849650 RepID=UPI001EE4C016|nr:cytochrome c oxidase subunit 3 [Salsipaludibacter albus]MBY5161374.1 cytochrome c oxidase subunit 3 [Salsipaludibacter albus]